MAIECAGLAAPLADRISAAKERSGITRTDLAAATGIAYSTLGRRLDGFTALTLVDLHRMALVLRISPLNLLPPVFTLAVAA